MSINRIRQNFKKTSFSIALGTVGLLLLSASFLMPTTQALTLDLDARDCDANAVIQCGASSTEELLQKYNNRADVRAIFNHFGISPAEMGRIGSTAAAGIVSRDGTVTVGGDVVATGAMTAGRQNMSGSSAINAGGTQFFMRSPATSFQTQRLKAFVVMDGNKQFAFAIIASCGNPVKATPKKPAPKPTPAPVKPVSQPKPQPQPKPAPPAPQPAPEQNQTQSQQQSSSSNSTSNSSSTSSANANASVTINQEKTEQPPAPQPPETVVQRVEVPVPTPAPAAEQPVAAAAAPVQELPKTGMESVGATLGIAGLATLLGTVAHLIYTRRKLVR